MHFVFLEDDARGRELLDRIVSRTRETGALGNLAYALDMLAQLDTRTGRLTAAYAGSLESIQLAESLGDTTLASAAGNLARVEAGLGRTEDARVHATRSLEISEARGDKYNVVRARGALGFDALARGDIAAALDWLEPAAAMLDEGGVHHPNLFRVHADLIEAQTRSGRREDAEANLSRLREDATLTGSVWAAATAARCHALLAEDADAGEAFAEALGYTRTSPTSSSEPERCSASASGSVGAAGAGSAASICTMRSRCSSASAPASGPSAPGRSSEQAVSACAGAARRRTSSSRRKSFRSRPPPPRG